MSVGRSVGRSTSNCSSAHNTIQPTVPVCFVCFCRHNKPWELRKASKKSTTPGRATPDAKGEQAVSIAQSVIDDIITQASNVPAAATTTTSTTSSTTAQDDEQPASADIVAASSSGAAEVTTTTSTATSTTTPTPTPSHFDAVPETQDE
jgi:hypothetical protein